MTFKGQPRSLEMSRFDRARTISYYNSVVTVALSFPTYNQMLVENR